MERLKEYNSLLYGLATIFLIGAMFASSASWAFAVGLLILATLFGLLGYFATETQKTFSNMFYTIGAVILIFAIFIISQFTWLLTIAAIAIAGLFVLIGFIVTDREGDTWDSK